MRAGMRINVDAPPCRQVRASVRLGDWPTGPVASSNVHPGNPATLKPAATEGLSKRCFSKTPARLRNSQQH